MTKLNKKYIARQVPNSSADGFTLLEILIVVALVGILGAMAVPSYVRIIDAEQVEANVSQFGRAITLSRSAAIMQGTPVQMCASSDGKSCGSDWTRGWITFTDENRNFSLDSGESILFRHTNTDELVVVNVLAVDGKKKSYVRFNYRGFLDAVATVDISRNNTDQKIILSVFGKPQLI